MKNFSYWLLSLHRDGHIEHISNFSNRFANDKIDEERDDFLIMADGIMLNKTEIVGENTSHPSITDYYIACYSSVDYINRLVGPFVAVIYNNTSVIKFLKC